MNPPKLFSLRNNAGIFLTFFLIVWSLLDRNWWPFQWPLNLCRFPLWWLLSSKRSASWQNYLQIEIPHLKIHGPINKYQSTNRSVAYYAYFTMTLQFLQLTTFWKLTHNTDIIVSQQHHRTGLEVIGKNIPCWANTCFDFPFTREQALEWDMRVHLKMLRLSARKLNYLSVVTTQ